MIHIQSIEVGPVLNEKTRDLNVASAVQGRFPVPAARMHQLRIRQDHRAKFLDLPQPGSRVRVQASTPSNRVSREIIAGTI